ncbi:HTH-type transcriptional regulator CynR [Roseovarius gaetbuli]|uniref:HTH-type transcriptional regulator CynR n=1 Tax=Roseovarius gaetbuli TaxID=1356575 RepID=A0A1X6Z7T4_9RHOB|nr:LysR family transcriptional regulator [Roseovarius gaetbuli]SLN43103.1 HTH-type transcriptional regulator CynR [Roseovarius gaetbuli]
MDKRISSLDWSLIRAFLTVADCGSLSAAARRLGASQPTLGRQVRQLETDLQQVLFHRQAKGLMLTENGELLIGPARRMQAALNEIELTAAGRQTQIEGSVRITASVMFSIYTLPPVIASLREKEPGITIDLVATDSTENLLFREADIALRMYRPEQFELVARHLGDLKLGMFAAKTYLDRAGRPETARDLLDHPLIGYDRNEDIIRGMQERGWSATREWFALRCDNHAVNWELVRAGCGVGFGQVELARHDPSVEQVMLDLNLPSLPIWIATHQALRQTPRIAQVWDALVEGLVPNLS